MQVFSITFKSCGQLSCAVGVWPTIEGAREDVAYYVQRSA